MSESIYKPATSAPLLSICIPTFNRAKYLTIVIDSIIKSVTDTLIEVVVCDNASTDDTQDVILEYSSSFPFIKYFRNERNIGGDRNVLNVMEYSTGEYCWLMGSDDAITCDAIPALTDALQSRPTFVMTGAINCDANLQPNGVLEFFRDGDALYDFSNNADILRFLKNATMHASLFGYMSSMIFKRSAIMEIPMARSDIGSAYPQVWRALDILVKKRGLMRYVAKPIVLNRRDNCSYENEFGNLSRHYIDMRMFVRAMNDYFSSNLEIRNQFKEYVRRCYHHIFANSFSTGNSFVDRFILYFKDNDVELPRQSWLLRPKVHNAIKRLRTHTIYHRLFSVEKILHIGFRGGFDTPTRPVNENAIGIDIGYSAYDGTILPFESRSQDTVWASHCIHKMPNPNQAIDEWVRVLKVGGHIAISCTVPTEAHSTSEASGLPPAGVNKRSFFGFMERLCLDPSCRIVHCSQTPAHQDTSGSPFLCEMDIVFEKTAPSVDDVAEALGTAMQHHQNGDLTAAAQLYESVLSAVSNNFAAVHMLGVVHFQRDQLDSAETLLRRAISINGGTAEAHYNLGCVLRRANRPDEARSRFEHSLALNPAFQMARDRLIEMQSGDT
jgi:abequosyltransferase